MPKPKKKTEGKVGGPDLKEVVPDAEKFKALGDPTRLAIVRYLLWQAAQDKIGTLSASGVDSASALPAGGQAVTIGDIAHFLTGDQEVKSSLSHHIKELRQAGLITVERDGQNKLCRAALPALQSLGCLLVAPEPVRAPATDPGKVKQISAPRKPSARAKKAAERNGDGPLPEGDA